MNWENFLGDMLKTCVDAGVKLLIALIMLIIGFKLIKMLTKKLRGEKHLGKLDVSVKSFMINALNIALKVLLVITVANYLGLPMTSMVAVLGSAGLALGLSLQGSLANLAGGIMLIIFKPFGVGDFIDAGGFAGTVTDIGIFYTKLTTADKKAIVIPNGILSNEGLTNASDATTRRVDLEFSAAYDADIDLVKKVLLETAAANDKVFTDPAPFTGLLRHGDNALCYVLRVWCNAEDYWDVYFALNENVKKAFDKEGISIPYPQLDVHMN